MAEHSIPQLRLEPRALGGHDAAGIGNGHEILNARREHRESARVFSFVDELFHFPWSANATDKIDSGAGARIGDAENRVKDVLLQQSHIEFFNWICRGRKARTEV